MRIVITTVQIPFVTGGAEFHAQNLKKALIERGHEAEIVSIPYMDWPIDLVEHHIVASRLFDLNNSWAGHIDLCIGLKFPAYFIPHDNKVLWILHQNRTAYDLFHSEYSGDMKDDEEGNRIRRVVAAADNRYIPEAKRVYANSGNVAKRLMQYNHIPSTPLYHPCPGMEQFYCESYGDYLLMPSRINITKRQMLAVEALTHTRNQVKLYIVGRADNELEMKALVSYVKEKGLEKRVKFFDFVSEEEKRELYAKAKGVLFIPKDEDYGYITLEGMASHKPVITATDSGGPLEFVTDGYNGFIAEPNAKGVAEAMDRLYDSGQDAEVLGRQAYEHLLKKNITWDYVVKELTRP